MNKQTVLWGLAGVAGAYFLGKYIVKDATAEVGNAVGKVGQAINPVSDQNIFYRGVNSLGAALTGDDGFNLGSWTYDVLHPEKVEQLTRTPFVVVDKQPPEASTLPNSWGRDTPGPSGRASVTKEQFNNMRTM